MSYVKEVHCKPNLHVIWRMAAILRDSTVVVAVVVRTRPRAIPLAMITMRKSIHGFPLVSYMGMGLRLATHRAAGAPLLMQLLQCDWLSCLRSKPRVKLVETN